jgi:hypothetical protein
MNIERQKIMKNQNKKDINILNEYAQWLKNKNLAPKTIEKYLHTIRQYGKIEINTNSIAYFLRENLKKHQPNTLKGQKNIFASYARFQNIYATVE